MLRENYSFSDKQYSVLLLVLFPGVIAAIKIMLAMHFSSEEQQLSSYSVFEWDINPKKPVRKIRLIRDSDYKRSSMNLLQKYYTDFPCWLDIT